MNYAARRLLVDTNERFVHTTQHSTYPRLCQRRDGSILAGFTVFQHQDGDAGTTRVLTVDRSTDGARTFEPLGEITRSKGDCDNLFLLELPELPEGEVEPEQQSTVLAAFRNHDLDDEGKHRFFRITVCQSRDGGQHWEFLSQAVEKPAPFGLWEPFMRMSQNGLEVQLFFSNEIAADDQDTMVVRSADRGRTWTKPECVTGDGERLRDGMVGVAPVRACGEHDALVLVMETTRQGTFSIEAVVSFDDGNTFGYRQVVYAPSIPGRNAGAPQVTSFRDGSVAVVFMSDEEREGEPRWPQGAKIKAIHGRLGVDGRFSWGPVEVVEHRPSSWPGIGTMADDAALAVYEHAAVVRGRVFKVAAEGAPSEWAQRVGIHD
ncbi:glycoside hydrolase family 93 protein [Chaetomium sp. MPI-SDFR-AT-0129]|nr:glycoside hydrolase family 93 protein [Chaetomium sp. MPI-SDFR-AT-0129]